MSLKSSNLLIIGKIPPPIGGVTIHVSRLIEQLKISGFPFKFLSLSLASIFWLIFNLWRFKVVHIHTSKPILRLFLVILSKIYRVKSIITFHGSLGRYNNSFNNFFDKMSIIVSNVPIVLNESSYDISFKMNNNSRIISAFIPPIVENEDLDRDTHLKIDIMRKNHKFLFSTNAYNYSLDKENKEIYGILELIQCFGNFPQYALIISDPSSAYSKKIKFDKIQVPENVILICNDHSFYKVMSLTDASIRNTSTDGDSLSVKESLYLNKLTFATDVVSRPNNVYLYKRGKFRLCLENLKYINLNENSDNLNGFPDLLKLYKNLD